MELPAASTFTMTTGRHYATGQKIMALTRSCPDDAPPAYRAARAIRAAANTTGRCPSCGGTMGLPNRHERRRAAALGEPAHVAIEHADDCPASDTGMSRTWISGAN
jgi:hypothetical protein